MIDADRMSSCKTNYHIIVTTTAPNKTIMYLKVVALNTSNSFLTN